MQHPRALKVSEKEFSNRTEDKRIEYTLKFIREGRNIILAGNPGTFSKKKHEVYCKVIEE